MESETTISPKIIPCYLVADSSSSRKSIRSLLSEFGAKPQQIHVMESLADAKDLIRAQAVPVIFVGQEVLGSGLEELIQLHEQSVPPGNPRAFFLLTSKGSNAEVSSAANDSVDGVLIRPFTFDMLKRQVRTVLEEKFFPKPHQQMINQGMALLKESQFEEALNAFRKSREISPDTVLSSYYIGTTLLRMGRRDHAKSSFEEGLAKNPTHYRCLLGLVELLSESKDYEGAYSFARKLAEHHPVPLKKIPDFIRLSVANLKFSDVLEFYKLVDGVESVDDSVAAYLGAGLAVCGLYFLRAGNQKQAIDVFKKAEIISKGNARILLRIMLALSREGLEEELNAFLPRMPEEVKNSVELQSAQLERLRANDPMLALKTAMDLVHSKVVDLGIFRAAIELSIDLKRKKGVVEELLDHAGRAFPDRQDDWDRYRSRLEGE